MPPPTYLLDTNVVNVIMADEGLADRMRAASGQGLARFVVTHVQVDELLGVVDEELRAQLIHALLNVGIWTVETEGFVLGPDPPHRHGFKGSRLGAARLSSDENAARHAAYVGDVPGRNADALLLSTAAALGLMLVTAETKPSNLNRMRRHFTTVEIISPGELGQRL